MRPEYLLGIGLQKRIMRAGPLSLELEADLFGHKAGRQQGGEFNQDTPYADLQAQSFGEGILGIGARLWVQPWLSFGFIEGISYNTDYSLYEKTFRENYTQLLNYLGFEVRRPCPPTSHWWVVFITVPNIRHLQRRHGRKQRLSARPVTAGVRSYHWNPRSCPHPGLSRPRS